MKFLGMKKVRDGKYLKNYELSYENKAGRLKTYEIVSRKELEDVQDLQHFFHRKSCFLIQLPADTILDRFLFFLHPGA